MRRAKRTCAIPRKIWEKGLFGGAAEAAVVTGKEAFCVGRSLPP